MVIVSLLLYKFFFVVSAAEHTAIMFRIASITLLLIMLVDNFYGHTASQAGFHVSKVHIRKCRCRVFANGRIQCRYPLFPSSHKEQQNVMKCFCSKTSQRKLPALKAACTTWRPGFPISLVVQVQPENKVQDKGQWSTGLCECHKDVGDCCFALCCLPVFTCKVTSAVGSCPCLPLLDCIGCVPPASLAMRASVRERYGIPGSVWSDCLYGCCCYTLSWLQISRELKRRAASHASSSSSSSSFSSSARYSALTSLQGAHLV